MQKSLLYSLLAMVGVTLLYACQPKQTEIVAEYGDLDTMMIDVYQSEDNSTTDKEKDLDEQTPTDVVSSEPRMTEADTRPWKKIDWEAASQGKIITFGVRNVGRLADVFNDSNYVHLDLVEKKGIRPISTISSAYAAGKRLAQVNTCKEFIVDTLKYSLPYLMPDALAGVKEIGRRFSETVRQRSNGGEYRMIITSVLRTGGTIKRLRRVNKNSVENSAHCYGRTIDITYLNFVKDDDRAETVSQDCLRGALTEVLDNMHKEGKIYIKYEAKQSCYHLTIK